MQSNNPVFRRSEEFNRPAANAYGNQTYAGNGTAYPGYGLTPTTQTRHEASYSANRPLCLCGGIPSCDV